MPSLTDSEVASILRTAGCRPYRGPRSGADQEALNAPTRGALQVRVVGGWRAASRTAAGCCDCRCFDISSAFCSALDAPTRGAMQVFIVASTGQAHSLEAGGDSRTAAGDGCRCFDIIVITWRMMISDRLSYHVGRSTVRSYGSLRGAPAERCATTSRSSRRTSAWELGPARFLRRQEGRSPRLHYTRAYSAGGLNRRANGHGPTDKSASSSLYFVGKHTVLATHTPASPDHGGLGNSPPSLP